MLKFELAGKWKEKKIVSISQFFFPFFFSLNTNKRKHIVICVFLFLYFLFFPTKHIIRVSLVV